MQNVLFCTNGKTPKLKEEDVKSKYLSEDDAMGFQVLLGNVVRVLFCDKTIDLQDIYLYLEVLVS